MRAPRSRRLPGKGEAAALLAHLLLALAVFFGARRFAPAGETVLIEQNGETVFSARLADLGEARVLEIGGAAVEVSRRGARFLESDCPDRLCVKAGLLTRAGESAVCLPNRVSVRITGGGGSIDAVTG